MIEDRQTDLLEVVLARAAAAAFTGRLNRGQEHANERADDRDHDQEFDEGKPSYGPNEPDGVPAREYCSHKNPHFEKIKQMR